MATIVGNGVFIHMPRTGSTSIRCAFRDANIPHKNSGVNKHQTSTIHVTLENVWCELNSKQKQNIFFFVRNPITHIRSLWIKKSKVFMDKLSFNINDLEIFDSFMYNYLKQGRPILTDYWKKFIKPPKDESPYVKICKLENLTEDFISCLEIAQVKFDKEAVKSSLNTPKHISKKNYLKREHYTLSPENLSGFINLEYRAFTEFIDYPTEINSYPYMLI